MKNYTLFPWPLIILVLLMLIGLHAMADEFSATLTASSNNNVTTNVLTFKTLNGSSNNFDVNDEPIPSPFTPIIPLFSYFPSTGNDSIFFVKTDARPDADTLSWPFKLRADNLGGAVNLEC